MVKNDYLYTPNTITYAVLVDSGIGRQINKQDGDCISHFLYW